MSILDTVKSELDGILPSDKIIVGYPEKNMSAPWLVIRPLYLASGQDTLDGNAVYWNNDIIVYCCAASVSTSFNLATAVVNRLHGRYVGGSTLAASVTANTLAVEGLYETHVTVSTNTPTL